MKKFASDIEKNMDFLLSGNLKKSLGASEAISHLSKASNLLENAGFKSYSEAISEVIKKAKTIDDSDIEVSL